MKKQNPTVLKPKTEGHGPGNPHWDRLAVTAFYGTGRTKNTIRMVPIRSDGRGTWEGWDDQGRYVEVRHVTGWRDNRDRPAVIDLATKPARIADARTWAGFRQARFNRQTGTLIVVVDNRDGAWQDPTEAPYLIICDDHSGNVACSSLAMARHHAAMPEWCEECQEIMDAA